MTTTAILMKEIEAMPESAAVEVLDFAMFLKGRYTLTQPQTRTGVHSAEASPLYNGIAIKDAHGIFKDLKGMDTTIERDEEDKHFEDMDRVHYFAK